MGNRIILVAVIALAAIVITVPAACASSAQFEVTSMSVKPVEVNAGETAGISAQVTNSGGAAGVYRAVLFIDGDRIDTRDISVGPGSSQTVTFSLSRGKAGAYRIEIGEKAATLTVKPRLVAKQMELKYDDGQAKDCLSLVKPCTGYLVSFVSPPNPFVTTQVHVFGLIYGTPGSRNGDMDLQVWDKDKKVLYRTPFTGDKFPLRTRVGPNIDSSGGWGDIDIPDIKVDGNFYINVYTGAVTGQGFRMGAEDNVKNTHSAVTVRGDNGVDSEVPNWPYSVAYWYGYKDNVNWMVRVAGKAMVPQE